MERLSYKDVKLKTDRLKSEQRMIKKMERPPFPPIRPSEEITAASVSSTVQQYNSDKSKTEPYLCFHFQDFSMSPIVPETPITESKESCKDDMNPLEW